MKSVIELKAEALDILLAQQQYQQAIQKLEEQRVAIFKELGERQKAEQKE